MDGIPTHVSAVTVDQPPCQKQDRTRYRITLACGCTWWEDHAPWASTLPLIGTTVQCFAAHSQRTQAREFPSLVCTP